MLRNRKALLLTLALLLPAGGGIWWATAEEAPATDQRGKLMKAHRDGNYKDAYEGLRKLALDPKDDPKLVGKDLTTAISCLEQLGRVDEIDAFREGVIQAHAKNWRLLETAAQSYVLSNQHQGFIVAGEFSRGQRRGNTGRFVNCWQRDRVRGLQLMQQALEQAKNEPSKQELARFYLNFARMLFAPGGHQQPWRLQYLTDLSQLPDYEEGYWWPHGEDRGAPVDDKGNPLLYSIPKSYADATNDGERWRWMLLEAAEMDAKRISEIDMALAAFLHSQFGVQTMAYYGWGARGDDAKNESGTYALDTLNDSETIARLATGIKRFKLPDEFNYIKIWQRVAARGKSSSGEHARDSLAHEYENRRQYPRAATAWREAIKEYGAGQDNSRQLQLEQIVGNWGRFEAGEPQPAGSKAIADFRFRNGTKVTFEAYSIKVGQLLADVKAYLKSSPGRIDWQKYDISNIGYRLVEQREAKYLGDKVATWDVALKPRPNHVDDRITVTTPLDKPGAYLLRAKMADGNLSRIVVWVSDTVIVKKQLEGQVLYYVADAVSGTPIAKADVEFFGWRQVQTKPNANEWKIETAESRQTTNDDGLALAGANKQPQGYQWLITAKTANPGRFAYLGFTGVWFGRVHDPEYHATKIFTITDRPVYRPAQTVHFKLWVGHAKYDQPDTSSFANQEFTVEITNPKGEKIFEKQYTTDAYGGIAGEFPLSASAPLGVYSVYIPQRGGGSFRVEEYKKPEYEVTVEAPKEPVRLGEVITANIQAKYYFGAPVTSAKVKYKVMRTTASSRWYPRGDWDWFYGSGYWWFAADYAWYPGWGSWGCLRPHPMWWHGGHEQPEVVLENEVSIGPDGTVPIVIDTKPAKELHGTSDHEYSITAEVVDESRRTIVGSGKVLVARKPFQVFAWLDRGHYRAGDTINASFDAHTLDNKPVEGKGELTLFKISYNAKREPVEKAVQTWKLDTNERGTAQQQIKAAEAGQYRLSHKVTDSKQHTMEGGYLFVIRGEGFDGKSFRFNDLELVTDRREYQPGDKVKLLVNTNKADGTVLLFVRPTNGIYLAPKVLRLKGKSIEEELAVVQKDMPNFFVEALTVADGRVHSETREVVVPPEKRVLKVEVLPSQTEYKPGQKATVKVKLTDLAGKPFSGSTVLTFYDKSVEYISGGSNVPEIKAFFWQWRRHHHPQTESSLAHWFGNVHRSDERGMADLGIFGAMVADEAAGMPNAAPGQGGGALFGAVGGMPARGAVKEAAPKDGAERLEAADAKAAAPMAPAPPPPPAGDVQPAIRKNFADTAFWAASLTTGEDGTADVSLTMPENLTGWKVKVWAMGHGTKVGQGEAEVLTKKDLLVRLQSPRFFVEKDEVVLSGNVHNYLKTDKDVRVLLELDGPCLAAIDKPEAIVRIPAGGEKRVDWRVKVASEGTAIVRMKAITDVESDALEMRFPSYIHGMSKTESLSGVVRPDKDSAQVTFTVPEARKINDSRLEVRYSPSLAGAMVDALPYLVDYPYGCTEQTLNRFVPTVITQRTLLRMKLDLKTIEEKRTNLNAQELGDARERAKGWKRFPRNPVFSEKEVAAMAQAGIDRLASMQCTDGGWGWFSGYGERSFPHTTAVVVHGLQLAKANGVPLPAGMVERGIQWLQNHQAGQVQELRNAATKTKPWKETADNVDALAFMILVDAGINNDEMRDFLYRDRTRLAVYAKAMFGLALHKQQQADKLAMILKNIEQYVVQDDENQTAYLRLPADNYWWCWYGSENEANAYYLKLLSKTNPQDQKASRLVKYLLNNRKNGSYWGSTRDTAVCIEAMADYMIASGEDKPDMTIEVWLDGKKWKDVTVNAENLFTFDNQFVLFGDAVETGKHVLEVKRKGTGPVYFNAYVTNFTLEDFITRAGLEVKVNRKYYKLTAVDKKIKVQGSRGQALDQKVEKYERSELPNLSEVKSGDLVEVELEIDSKNDYEYLIFEDPKAAGFEPVLLRSGYNPNDLGAYMELRDDRVVFFVRALPRGKSSVAYRLRAEIPGKFSALPTRASAMYAPELKGNSDEIKLVIKD
jgi:uncharacterized protein YfaS (alpha-2-macroglobulin family)